MSDKRLPAVTALTRPFWDAVQRGELHLQQCDACAHWVFYPNTSCTACFADALSWRACSGAGIVYSYSVVSQAPYAAFAADVPYVIATVRLAEGPQMMTNIVNCDPLSVVCDMAVRFTTEIRGDGFRLPQFEPVT